jgi:hypothetical protein
MGENRRSYNRRRTEQRARDIRDRKRLESSQEYAETDEERQNIEQFFKTRGIDLSDGNKWVKDLGEPKEEAFRVITVTVKNIKVKELKSLPLVRKPQPPPETKSLKAAYLREIAMNARRNGLIKQAYTPEEGIKTVQWGEEWEGF